MYLKSLNVFILISGNIKKQYVVLRGLEVDRDMKSRFQCKDEQKGEQTANGGRGS